MASAYVVNISVHESIFEEYMDWLMDHIKGNSQKEIKGMLEVVHEGAPLFLFAEMYVSENIGDRYLISVHYFSDHPENLDIYLEHYAEGMRATMPRPFQGSVHIVRYEHHDGIDTPIGQSDPELEALFIQFREDIHFYKTIKLQ